MNKIDNKMPKGSKVFSQNQKAIRSSMEIEVTDLRPRENVFDREQQPSTEW